MKPRLHVILGVTAAGAAIALLAYAFAPAAIRVDIAQVTRAPLNVTVDEDGKTRVKERYVVSSPLAGRLLRIELDEGDPVYAGKTLLASIAPADPSLLDPRAQAEAEARVRVAEASADQATARLKAAEELQMLAEHHFERARPLRAQGAISQEEMDEREHQYRVATENLHGAKFGKQVAEFEVTLAKAALVRTRAGQNAESTAEQFTIHAPVDGHVLRVIQESATVVTPGTPLIEVGNSNELEVEADVLSADAARIRPGAKVALEHWGGDFPLAGRVRVIEPSGFTKLSALGVEEQRVNVIIDFDDPPEKRASLGDGYRVEARIVIWEHDDVLQIPAGALFRDGAEWAVFAATNGRAALRHVEVGQNNGVAAQILSGLDVGEAVILHPSDRIVSGSRVENR
jgi:HlyD family secretion protein